MKFAVQEDNRNHVSLRESITGRNIEISGLSANPNFESEEHTCQGFVSRDLVFRWTDSAQGAHSKQSMARRSGRVIEIGAGTGANLPFYSDEVFHTRTFCEPSEPMARRLERKLASFGRPVRVVRAPAENLPVETASFDVAVSTLVLCTVGDPRRALAELYRVLKPGGRLLFIEHVRADEPRPRALAGPFELPQ